MADEMSMEEIKEISSRLRINLDEIDRDNIRLPPGEGFGIKSDDEDLREGDQLEFSEGLDNVVVIDNLPMVPKEKFEKLENVLRKIYSQPGTIKENGLWMPVDPNTGKTLGFCFIEYNTPQEAELAKEKTQGYKLDKAHIFAVNMFDDIEKFLIAPDEWAPPESKSYVPGENLQKWLTDEKARDQFVIRSGSDTEVVTPQVLDREFRAVFLNLAVETSLQGPASFLTPEKEEEIAKNLKKYEAEDEDVSQFLSEQDREKRQTLREEWKRWVEEWKKMHELEKLSRQELRDGEVSDEEEEYEAKEVEFEELVDVKEEVIPFEE